MNDAKKIAKIVKYLMLAITLIGFGAIFAITISAKLQPKKAPSQARQKPPASTAPATASLEGKSAPAFSLKNLKGATVQLADYRGKIVFLNFWATWCDPCKEEMPSMQRLYKKMQGRPFEILAVSQDINPREAVPDFVKKTKLQLDFPVLEDPNEKVSKTLYKTTGVPETFIIGADGKVIKHVIGAYEWDSSQILDYFETLLKDVHAS